MTIASKTGDGVSIVMGCLGLEAAAVVSRTVICRNYQSRVVAAAAAAAAAVVVTVAAVVAVVAVGAVAVGVVVAVVPPLRIQPTPTLSDFPTESQAEAAPVA